MFDFGFGFGFGCKCWSWNRIANSAPPDPETFSLPSPLPHWPLGEGFASGRINLGEIEVVKVETFESIWCSYLSGDSNKGVSFYKPCGIPDGFHCLGHYSQSNNQPLQGFLLVAREAGASQLEVVSTCYSEKSPPLCKPLDYTLIWSSDDGNESGDEACGYFWLPQAPEGYKSLGFLVTNRLERPDLDEVRCVREDLTDECQTYKLVVEAYSKYANFPLQVWSMRPAHRGMMTRAVSVGTFFCTDGLRFGKRLNVACLKNTDPKQHAMPNLEQINALIQHYGPTVFFHPKETYLPSSVPWFFKNGALIYMAEDSTCKPIDNSGSILPGGGRDDGAFWIDLPRDDTREMVKCGNLESAKLYVHVKPSLGGTFTDIVMWVFCPFNGPATLKVGLMNIALSKVGEHVSDWEHFTLRICNFTGELWSIYFSQHDGGEWVDACKLEYIEGNRAIVYSSRNGHASFPHAGTYIQGSAKLRIGIRNDAARSKYFIDSSRQYEIFAAEYLKDNTLNEPSWLQYMRKWGPTIVYDSRGDIDKIIKVLPAALKYSIESIFNKLPVELYGEEGPTGPKEKDNWLGDERC